VIVVNAYCSLRDTQAFRVEVYSPTRGRVRIYAESAAPVSGHVRQQYFSFTAESEPPPGPGAPVPTLALGMSFAELQRYDEQRYKAYLPACCTGPTILNNHTRLYRSNSKPGAKQIITSYNHQ